jgi:hypothetical protein
MPTGESSHSPADLVTDRGGAPERSFVERNAASRARLRVLVERLTPADLEREMDGGWSVAALLAHVAFWDRFVAVRWRAALDTGALMPMSFVDEAVDLVYEAALPSWRALEPDRAWELAMDASAEVDEVVAGLPNDSVVAIARQGRPRLLDRSLHRGEHIDAIEAATRS